jgi:hypothetical protein
VKCRASYTLAVFDEIFTRPGALAVLRQPVEDGTRGAVLMDILYDPPLHERLPVNDDEIIDRALAAQGTGGSPVTLLTYGTSQAGPGTPRRARRQEARQATRGRARRHPQEVSPARRSGTG